MTRQRQLGERYNTRYLYQKVQHRRIHGIGQMVSFGGEAVRANKGIGRTSGWPHFFKVL